MRRHWLFVLSVLAVTTIGTMVVSSAQQRQVGGVGLTVFADSNFRGKTQTFRRDVSDLARYGLNDRISSLRVGPGEQWEVCEHANYQGRCVVVSGEEPDLGRNSLSDIISSFRRVGGSGGGGSAGPTPPQGNWYMVLYDQPNYRGRVMRYKAAAAILSGFTNRAQSVTIGKGVWELCEGTNWIGRCVTLEQSVPDLSRVAAQIGREQVPDCVSANASAVLKS
jgi:Beta/Gamma crystallin